MTIVWRWGQLAVCFAIAFAGWPSASLSQSVPKTDDPEALYRDRTNLDSAKRAAALWSARVTSDFDSAWKLARITYWIGKHAPNAERRPALERGIAAGEMAVRLMPDRPEGHFWLAADMGALAESSGI